MTNSIQMLRKDSEGDGESKTTKPECALVFKNCSIWNLTVGVYDKAVVLVLCDVDSDINHNRYLAVCLFDAVRIHRALYVL